MEERTIAPSGKAIGSPGRAARSGALRRVPWVLLACLLGFPGASAPAAAQARVDFVVGLGQAVIPDVDVEASLPGDTRLTYRAVGFRDESFEKPLYWSLRINRWRSPERGWGWGLDLTHAKAVAEVDRVVSVRGRRAGLPVRGSERIGDTLEHLEFSHGLNVVTLNLLYRWSGESLRPYAGAGAGVALPHVEVTAVGERTEGYQLTGPAAEGRLGLELRLGRHFFVAGEYKLTFVQVSADLEGTGTIRVDPLVHQLVVGLGFHR